MNAQIAVAYGGHFPLPTCWEPAKTLEKVLDVDFPLVHGFRGFQARLSQLSDLATPIRSHSLAGFNDARSIAATLEPYLRENPPLGDPKSWIVHCGSGGRRFNSASRYQPNFNSINSLDIFAENLK